ncbi:hypothetical protein [Botrimarina sp.]|uniref:hypothetical protein n=1 Tax=Botrimarina sp. TaxID=2795802 RepID=UPI0032EF011E
MVSAGELLVLLIVVVTLTGVAIWRLPAARAAVTAMVAATLTRLAAPEWPLLAILVAVATVIGYRLLAARRAA